MILWGRPELGRGGGHYIAPAACRIEGQEMGRKGAEGEWPGRCSAAQQSVPTSRVDSCVTTGNDYRVPITTIIDRTGKEEYVQERADSYPCPRIQA